MKNREAITCFVYILYGNIKARGGSIPFWPHSRPRIPSFVSWKQGRIHQWNRTHLHLESCRQDPAKSAFSQSVAGRKTMNKNKNTPRLAAIEEQKFVPGSSVRFGLLG